MNKIIATRQKKYTKVRANNFRLTQHDLEHISKRLKFHAVFMHIANINCDTYRKCFMDKLNLERVAINDDELYESYQDIYRPGL